MRYTGSLGGKKEFLKGLWPEDGAKNEREAVPPAELCG